MKTIKMKYYHVTHPKNIPSILENGLNAEDNGEGYEEVIFVLTETHVAANVAINQCGLRDYALFSIDEEGVYGKIEMDRVAEMTAPYHRIIHQKSINPEYLELEGCWKSHCWN